MTTMVDEVGRLREMRRTIIAILRARVTLPSGIRTAGAGYHATSGALIVA